MPTSAEARDRLNVGDALDRLWRETMGLPPGDSKEGTLRLIALLLDRERVPYALIGGVAVQIRTEEPRTTLDIDIAVRAWGEVPGAVMVAAGFVHVGRHPHSDNWRAPGEGPLRLRTAVQFSAEDEGLEDAVRRASAIDLGGVPLRVASAVDLVVLKLAAASEPARRPSKRAHDVADVLALLEADPAVSTPEIEARLSEVRRELLASRAR